MRFAWHVHHEILVESLTEPIRNRRLFIKEHKHPSEIATRLRLLRAVRGKLPSEYIEASKAYQEAYKACEEASKAYQEAYKASQEAYKASQEAYKAYQEAYKAYLPEIEALHRLECKNCPWDGHTIFP